MFNCYSTSLHCIASTFANSVTVIDYWFLLQQNLQQAGESSTVRCLDVQMTYGQRALLALAAPCCVLSIVMELQHMCTKQHVHVIRNSGLLIIRCQQQHGQHHSKQLQTFQLRNGQLLQLCHKSKNNTLSQQNWDHDNGLLLKAGGHVWGYHTWMNPGIYATFPFPSVNNWCKNRYQAAYLDAVC